MSTTETKLEVAPAPHWLRRAPTSLFAIVMETGGLTIAWRKAHAALGVSSVIGKVVVELAAAAFAVILLIHLARALIYRSAHYEEFQHPVGAYFVPTFSVATAIMAGGLAPYDLQIARWVWIFGAGIHFILAFLLLRRWFFVSRYAVEVRPSWFIPVVGTILMPVIGVPIGFVTASWFMFSIGAMFWLILAPIMTYRLFFLGSLPEKALPSTFIMLAPPAIGGLAIIALNDGQVNSVTHVLLGFATFIALLMLSGLARVFTPISRSVGGR